MDRRLIAIVFAPTAANKPWLTRRPRKSDCAGRDTANRRLGTLGEEFVFELEQYRLLLAGRDDLARRVAWALRDIGNGSAPTGRWVSFASLSRCCIGR